MCSAMVGARRDGVAMPSNQFLLAASWKGYKDPLEVRARIDEATQHVEGLSAKKIQLRYLLKDHAVLVAWKMVDDPCDWPIYTEQEGGAAAWLNVPYCSGGPASGSSAYALATSVTTGRKPAAEVGVPFAAITLSASGELLISNDIFGAAHLFHFDFPGLDVWSSRPGLAHIFSGVEPFANREAWEGMATLGWSPRGKTHLGQGQQLAPLSRVRVLNGRSENMSSGPSEWITPILEGGALDLREAAAGMVQTLETTGRWMRRPVSDLSGGKDSRVIAAAAICAGSIDAVRTVRTDHGEVSTAQELMSHLDGSVSHVIVEPRDPQQVQGGVLERLASQHRMWEGYYLARTAFKTPAFSSIKQSPSARLNGLGGEAIQGGTSVSEAWKAKILAGGFEVADQRLRGMVRSSIAATEASRSGAEDSILELSREVHDLGMRNPLNGIDYVYNFSKMPYWSMPFGSRDVVMPFYSPSLLGFIGKGFVEPSEYGRMHREMLRELIPSWADVSFYKPSARTRASSFMWEFGDWPESQELLEDRADLASSFDKDELRSAVSTINSGQGAVRHEIALVRALWEISFHDYVAEVAESARRTRDAVSIVIQGATSSIGDI